MDRLLVSKKNVLPTYAFNSTRIILQSIVHTTADAILQAIPFLVALPSLFRVCGANPALLLTFETMIYGEAELALSFLN